MDCRYRPSEVMTGMISNSRYWIVHTCNKTEYHLQKSAMNIRNIMRNIFSKTKYTYGIVFLSFTLFTFSCGAKPIVLDNEIISSNQDTRMPPPVAIGELNKNARSINIYMNNGIELTFRRAEKDYIPDKTSFYDIWQLWEAFGSKEDGSRDIRIVRSGEWETAIKINDDFVGGVNHGFERKTSVQFLLDGQPIAEEEDIVRRPFHSFYVLQETDLYAYNSTDEKIARIMKQWDFKEGGTIELRQTVKWLSPQSLRNTYLAMLPVSRDENGINITSKAERDDIRKVFDVSQAGHKNPLGPGGKNSASTSLTLWGDTYKLRVSIDREDVLANSSLWLSNANIYNKIYFDYTGRHEVKKDEVFDILVRFELGKTD